MKHMSQLDQSSPEAKSRRDRDNARPTKPKGPADLKREKTLSDLAELDGEHHSRPPRHRVEWQKG